MSDKTRYIIFCLNENEFLRGKSDFVEDPKTGNKLFSVNEIYKKKKELFLNLLKKS